MFAIVFIHMAVMSICGSRGGRNMETSALNIAKYTINKCAEEGNPISNLHLQKILYFIQREFLKNGIVAFSDRIEAWQFGPVVPDVYAHYCGFGAMRINRNYNIILDSFDKQKFDMINSVIAEKSIIYPWDLVEETHEKGKAWDIIFKDGDGNKAVIPTELIKELG